MSELTECNYCTLRGIRDQAGKRGERTLVLPASAYGNMGGLDVFTYPRAMLRRDLLDAIKTRAGRKKYFRAWLMELTDHCVC